MRKALYIAFIGALSSSAAGACYWQTNRYFESTAKWKKIKQQLNKQSPQSLNLIDHQGLEALNNKEIYPFKYLSIKGQLSDEYHRIDRIKNGRTGYLVVRSLRYKDEKEGKDRQIMALEGWCQASHQYKIKRSESNIDKDIEFRGILRQKEKKDYLHQNMPQAVLEKHNIKTYIDLQRLIQKLNLTPNNLNQNYYFQMFRPLDAETDAQPYPYQYSVDNFQLPYLTPDKHASYAAFWLLTTMVGLKAIRIVMKFK